LAPAPAKEKPEARPRFDGEGGGQDSCGADSCGRQSRARQIESQHYRHRAQGVARTGGYYLESSASLSLRHPTRRSPAVG